MSAILACGPASTDERLAGGERWGAATTAYVRAGGGLDATGDDQVCFQAPGARAKYRLGNECEFYGELAGTLALTRGSGGEDAETPIPNPLLSLTGRVALYAGPVNGYETRDLTVRELFGAYTFAGDGAELWAGRRFYKRNDVHINDFYYWTGTGVGAGIADLAVGPGKVSAAVLNSASNDAGLPDLGDERDYVRLDLRMEGIGLGEERHLDLGADLRFEADAEPGAPDHGLMLVAQHTHGDVRGAELVTALQLGTGAATSLSNRGAADASEGDVAARLLTYATLLEQGPWSGQALALVEVQSGAADWASLGARPVYGITERFSLALEAGGDLVRDDGEMRLLGKLTAAAELKAGTGFYDRPVLRAFVTTAAWSDAAARVSDALDDDNAGLTIGIQFENFW